jgi:hypothetical protein
MSRDLIGEIEAVRTRSKISNHYIVAFSLGVLKSRVKDVSTQDSEVLGYFPVATVAHLDTFFKHALRDLLDFGEPFLGRCNQLLKDGRVTLDSSVAVALSGRRVTFGELIAASLRYSDLLRSAGYFSQLLNTDFLGAVRKQYDSSPAEAAGDFDGAMAALASLYKTRHIIAHEVRPALTLTRQEVLQWIESAFSFLRAAGAVIEPSLFPGGLPKTQAEVNERAAKAAQIELEALEGAYSRLGEVSTTHKNALQEVLAGWRTFALKASDLAAEMLAGGGTMAQSLRSGEFERLAASERERVEALASALAGRATG